MSERVRRYDLLLCDADETLLDFTRAERAAFFAICPAFAIPETERSLQAYSASNLACWKRFERGELTQGALRIRRFVDFFAALALSGDPVRASQAYEEALSRQGFVLPGAPEAVRRWQRITRVVVVTNGIAAVQRGRFARSPLCSLAGDMLISEEVGAAKPDPAMIHLAMARAGVSDPSRVLLLGDSLTSDMAAAARAGIDGCWLNPAGKALPDLPIRHVVRTLDEVDALLEAPRWPRQP